jgi:DnaD/phage-associated family protein
MPFVSYSSQLVLDNHTAISNVFIEQYLPVCNGDCARVYLYGLHMCNAATRFDNTLQHFATNLNLTPEDILSAFTYWQDQGLVQILTLDPIEVKYLPVRSGSAKAKKYAQDKYADFNVQIQAILEGRMITPSEFSEYYAFLESFHVEPSALVMIASYCVKLKGNNIGYSYILTVARSWASAGIKTVEAVTEKIDAEHTNSGVVTQILAALKQKRAADPTDFELYEKWTKKLGYSTEVILFAAKSCKGNMTRLDTMLLKYFELKLFEKDEIANYEQTKSDMYGLAIAINKKIGVYYENVENIIETYLAPWCARGFDSETLLSVAAFCFKSGIRDLKGMDGVITKFYKMGIMNPTSIDEFIQGRIAEDKQIKEVLTKLNLTREPNALDRDFYNTWKQTWNISPELLDYTITLSADKTSPMVYMNKVLSSFYEKKITTVDAAKASSLPSTAQTQKSFTRHSYTDGELNRLFQDINDVEF